MAEAGKLRRSKGEGSIVQRSDGRWMGRYTVILGDGTKKRQCIILKRRADVAEKMRAEMALADHGTPVLRNRRTTGDYLNYWIIQIAPKQIRATTMQLYTSTVRNYLLPQLGKIPLTQLKPEHVRMMLNRMESSGCGARTLQHARNTLSAALREALKLEYVSRNVARLIDLPKYSPPEKNVWAKEQVAQFIEKNCKHKYYPLFLLLLCCGLRRGEALGLRWQDIDFNNSTVKIRKTLYWADGKYQLGEPKTKASIRDIPMPPAISEALLRHQRREPIYDDNLVFHSEKGNPVCARSLLWTFRDLAQKADLPPLTLHEARHTAATLLAGAWSSPKEAQAILGHASIVTTLQIYTHTHMDKKAEAINALANSVF